MSILVVCAKVVPDLKNIKFLILLIASSSLSLLDVAHALVEAEEFVSLILVMALR